LCSNPRSQPTWRGLMNPIYASAWSSAGVHLGERGRRPLLWCHTRSVGQQEDRGGGGTGRLPPGTSISSHESWLLFVTRSAASFNFFFPLHFTVQQNWGVTAHQEFAPLSISARHCCRGDSIIVGGLSNFGLESSTLQSSSESKAGFDRLEGARDHTHCPADGVGRNCLRRRALALPRRRRVRRNKGNGSLFRSHIRELRARRHSVLATSV